MTTEHVLKLSDTKFQQRLADPSATYEAKPATDADIAAFVAALNAKWSQYHHYEVHPGGDKYVRIVTTRGQLSCWGYVERATGYILKSAGWHGGPAKNKHGKVTPRGTIHTSTHGVEYCEWTGPRYLR
jgi:hypothetical protein